MGCRSRCYLCYFSIVGVLFMGSSMYAFLVSRTAADCPVGCPVSLLTLPFDCAGTAETGDAATITDAYNNRCFSCSAKNAALWPCSPDIGRQDCRDAGGVMLEADACGGLAGAKPALVNELKALPQFADAQGACIEFLATDIDYNPSIAPTLDPSGSGALVRPSYASVAAGPGIQVVVNESRYAGSTLNPACTAEALASNAVIGRLNLCYSVPSRFTLRGLLIPGLLAFVFALLAQSACSCAAGFSLCAFSRVRNEGWARLSQPMRYVGVCVKLMPQVLCFFHVITGVVVFASLSFIQAGVCRNAQDSAGDYTFFKSGANLVYFAVALWSVASCGGFYRKTCLPDAGLASPQSASDVDPPESKLAAGTTWAEWARRREPARGQHAGFVPQMATHAEAQHAEPMISAAVAVALDGFAWVQSVPPALGHRLVADLGSPAGSGRRLRELSARPAVHGCIGTAYAVDSRTVVASARAIERLILAAAGPALLDDAPPCYAVSVGGTAVLASPDEVTCAATDEAAAARRLAHDDAQIRLPLAASLSVAVRGAAPPGQPYGAGLAGVTKRAVGGTRLLVVGAVDFVSPRVAGAIEAAAARGSVAAAAELGRVPAAFWRCLYVRCSGSAAVEPSTKEALPAAAAAATAGAGDQGLPWAQEAASIARAQALGLGSVEVAQAEPDADADPARPSARLSQHAKRQVCHSDAAAGPWRWRDAVSLLDAALVAAREAAAAGSLDSPREVVVAAASADDGSGKCLLQARVGELASAAEPLSAGCFVADEFAKAILAAKAAAAARPAKRPRQDPAPGTSAGGFASAAAGAASASGAAPATTIRSSLEASILELVPKGHDARRRQRAEQGGGTPSTAAKPVRHRIPDPGPWHGLSMDPWADPLPDPRVQRLLEQDRAWAAATTARGPPSVAIVVPFRGQAQQNRAQQLERFARQFPDWFATLRPAPRRWHVVVVEQTDDGFKFNRGKLLNIGFDLVSNDRGPDGRGFGAPPTADPAAAAGQGGTKQDVFDIVVMHDVDLIPTHPGFADMYLRPRPGPMPIAKVWDKYRYPNYIGGITGFSAPLFRKINGYPNNFWGWGGEDDDLRRRLEAVGHPPATWEQPPASLNGRIRDLEEELIAERGGQRASVKLKEGGSAETLNMVRTERLKETFRSWWRNGLCSLDYRVRGYRSLGPRVTVVTVDLLAAADRDSVRLTDLPEWAKAKGPKRARH